MDAAETDMSFIVFWSPENTHENIRHTQLRMTGGGRSYHNILLYFMPNT